MLVKRTQQCKKSSCRTRPLEDPTKRRENVKVLQFTVCCGPLSGQFTIDIEQFRLIN
jgi:hypothetical protein